MADTTTAARARAATCGRGWVEELICRARDGQSTGWAEHGRAEHGWAEHGWAEHGWAEHGRGGVRDTGLGAIGVAWGSGGLGILGLLGGLYLG